MQWNDIFVGLLLYCPEENLGYEGGTLDAECEEMCPEEERIDRTQNKQLAVFELMPGPRYATSPELCVKKFQRSCESHLGWCSISKHNLYVSAGASCSTSLFCNSVRCGDITLLLL